MVWSPSDATADVPTLGEHKRRSRNDAPAEREQTSEEADAEEFVRQQVARVLEDERAQHRAQIERMERRLETVERQALQSHASIRSRSQTPAGGAPFLPGPGLSPIPAEIQTVGHVVLGPPVDWSVHEVAVWLRQTVHLPEYATLFVQQAIDGETLLELELSELAELGVRDVHRPMLIAALEQLAGRQLRNSTQMSAPIVAHGGQVAPSPSPQPARGPAEPAPEAPASVKAEALQHSELLAALIQTIEQHQTPSTVRTATARALAEPEPEPEPEPQPQPKPQPQILVQAGSQPRMAAVPDCNPGLWHTGQIQQPQHQQLARGPSRRPAHGAQSSVMQLEDDTQNNLDEDEVAEDIQGAVAQLLTQLGRAQLPAHGGGGGGGGGSARELELQLLNGIDARERQVRAARQQQQQQQLQQRRQRQQQAVAQIQPQQNSPSHTPSEMSPIGRRAEIAIEHLARRSEAAMLVPLSRELTADEAIIYRSLSSGHPASASTNAGTDAGGSATSAPRRAAAAAAVGPPAIHSGRYRLSNAAKIRREHDSVLKALKRAMSGRHRTLNGKKIGSSRAIFAAMDRDNSGTLDIEEFYAAMRRLGLGLTDEQVLGLADALDRDRDGTIDYNELLEYLDGDLAVGAGPKDGRNGNENDGGGSFGKFDEGAFEPNPYAQGPPETVDEEDAAEAFEVESDQDEAEADPDDEEEWQVQQQMQQRRRRADASLRSRSDCRGGGGGTGTSRHSGAGKELLELVDRARAPLQPRTKELKQH